MTTNNEEYRVVEDISEEHKEGLKIVEEDEFDNDEVLNERWEKLYEENQEAFDLLGGIDIFEAILDTPDENFEELSPHFLAIFTGLINEPAVESELRLEILSKNYTIDIFPFYGSDIGAASRAGVDFKGALIGTGVSASHGMERTHIKGIENTLKLIYLYLIK